MRGRLRGAVALLLSALLLGGCASPPARGAAAPPNVTLRVAAASDVKFALDELIELYRLDNPNVAIEPSYGSSGNFSAQLANGAPFDVFLSADTRYPDQLAEAGLTVAGSEFDYAVGRIVAWSAADKGFDLEHRGLDALTDPEITRIAIANPRHAPYGVAAVAALRNAGVYDEIQPKLVYGENIAQAADFVASGAAEVGILALSLTKSPPLKGAGDVFEIPLDAYPRLNQGGVVLNSSIWPDEAGAFVEFLSSAPALEVFDEYGFIRANG